MDVKSKGELSDKWNCFKKEKEQSFSFFKSGIISFNAFCFIFKK